MNTRNWIIAAVAVVLLIAIYFVVFQPGAERHGNRSGRLQLPSQPRLRDELGARPTLETVALFMSMP